MSDQIGAAARRQLPCVLQGREDGFPRASTLARVITGSIMACRTAAICALLLFAGAAWADASVQTPDAIDASRPPLERGRALAALSLKLVETAQSGKGHASGFRIDVAHYRENLRDLVKDNETLPEKDRLRRTLVLDMVRMAALLQSAAQCQTGRYIVCPPDLMERLQRQQALVEHGLAPQPSGH